MIAFDASVLKRVEELKKVKGYYPALREIGESYDPPHSVGFVFRALRRLSEAGLLTAEASQIYATKIKGKTNESVNKTSKAKK